jgi:hypothetical protein
MRRSTYVERSLAEAVLRRRWSLSLSALVSSPKSLILADYLTNPFNHFQQYLSLYFSVG